MAASLNSPLGIDFSCIDDIDANLTLASGRQIVGESTARRITTRRGGLFYDDDYGTDIRGRINRPFTASRYSRMIEAEALKDQRVDDVAAVAQLNRNDDTATIEITIVTEEGPFSLTSTIAPDGTITVDVLNEGL